MRFSGWAAVVLAERGVRHHIAHMLADAGPPRHDHRGLGALYDLPACRLAPWRLRPVSASLPGANAAGSSHRVTKSWNTPPDTAQYIAEPSAAVIRISRPAPMVPPLRSRMLDAKIQLMFDYGRHHQVSFDHRRIR
jgi:hypothetical protein